MTNSKGCNPEFDFEKFQKQNIPSGNYDSKDTELVGNDSKIKDGFNNQNGDIMLADDGDSTPKQLIAKENQPRKSSE